MPDVSEWERLERAFHWRIQDHAVRRDGVWFAGEPGRVSFPEDAHQICSTLEERSFWFHHRNAWIKRLVLKGGPPAAFWEIGAGNGFVAKALQNSGLRVVAVEPGPDGARQASRRGVPAVCGLLETLKLPECSLPAAGAFDVLEHLERPEEMLRELHRLLAPGGRLALSVPALPVLWSQADEASGHFRRYSRQSLDALLWAAGFERIASGYIMLSMAVPLYFLRSRPYRKGKRFSKEEFRARSSTELAPRRGPSVLLADAALWLERQWTRVLPLPLGTSVLGLYFKPPGRSADGGVRTPGDNGAGREN